MASSYPTIRYGSSGQEVRRLQQALNREGYSLDVDGGFGKKTLAALMDYQRRVGMTPDGVAGSKTWASLGLQSAQDRLADLEKGYTPSRETQEARRSWEELAAQQPGDYTSPYADRMEDLLRQMESREAFSYDPSRDEMFRRYARLYQRQGQTAIFGAVGAGTVNDTAPARSWTKVAQFLIDNGARLDIKDARGRTLIDAMQGLEQGEILHIPGPDLQNIHLIQVLQLAGVGDLRYGRQSGLMAGLRQHGNARLAQPTSRESFLRGKMMLTSTPRCAAVQIACRRSSLGTK